MTLITVDAVVDVARHLVMLEVVRVIPTVAARALEHRVIVRIRVAGRADAVCISVCGRELRVLRVIECRARPGSRVVAVLARRREELRLRRVSRIGRVVVIGLVAADARRGQRRVVVVDVAIRAHARRHHVRSGKGKGCVVVVERGVGPGRRIVAQLARRREAGRGMRRVGSAGVVLLMA